eukprot:4714008-Prymnesium_polylepis.1
MQEDLLLPKSSNLAAAALRSKIQVFSTIPLGDMSGAIYAQEHLDLRPNGASRCGLVELLVLAGALHPMSARYNAQIKSVDLRENCLTDVCGIILEKVIVASPRLVSINLLHNHVRLTIGLELRLSRALTIAYSPCDSFRLHSCRVWFGNAPT